eukprot:TRINITY_DN27592_c0_g2_i1.p1 TRINITY_DN27592_c0_g2~~TRINITY_DN27592_c0_g2_i1.p1  ORF type:complete len:962 (-),score=155.66 TRINITY_DN27592_c0_g2_i1:84-2969(-)
MRGASPSARGMRGMSPGGRLPPLGDPMDEDVMVKALDRSSIHQVLKAARASLAEPSRPFTPADRSLFQMADSGSASQTGSYAARPNSSYSVDQLSFVKDTFGRTDSARSNRASKPRYESIAEEADSRYRREGGSDVLRLDDDDASSAPRRSPQDSDDAPFSSDDDLTPVVASTSSGAPLPPRTPKRPPRPPGPGGGYPSGASASATRLSGGSSGYPDSAAGVLPTPPAEERSSSRRRSDASPRNRRRIMDCSPGPNARRPSPSPSPSPGGASSSGDPGTPSRRTRSKTGSDFGFGDLSQLDGEAWDNACEATVKLLQSFSDTKERKKSGGAEDILRVCDRVADLVDGIKAGQGSKSGQMAPMLLRAVLALLDLKDTTCLFRLSRCALALLQVDAAVSGVHSSGVQAAYLNIAKVLFKSSKVEGHDADFLKEGLLVPLLEVLQSSAPECASDDLRVYIVGVLKNVSMDEGNQKYLVQHGAVSALFHLMALDQLTGAAKEAQLLIQITATLRSLAGSGYKHFLTDERMDALTKIMSLFPTSLELLTNISRTLAKLTLHTSACEAYVKNDSHIRQLTNTLSANADHEPLVLRLSFVLGNLTAKSDRMRMVFGFDCEGNSLIPQLLGKYWQKDRQLNRLQLETGTTAAGAQEIEEILVKLVRVLANVAISAPAGSTLSASSAAVDPLLDMLGAKRIGDSEELVLNVVAAVTNLLFYDVPSNILFQEENKQLLCRLFRPLLLESYNVEALIETARALGNLSRHADARNCMASLRLDEVLVILLDHDDRDLVFYVCGALVNLAADAECTERLMTVCPLVEKLGRLLADVWDEKEMSLQLVSVKVLTNLSLDTSTTWPTHGSQEVRGALEMMIASDGSGLDEAAAADREQLLELSQHLLARLPPGSEKPLPTPDAAKTAAQDSGAKGGGGDANFVCPAPGCGRTFTSKGKLNAHVERRHAELSQPDLA